MRARCNAYHCSPLYAAVYLYRNGVIQTWRTNKKEVKITKMKQEILFSTPGEHHYKDILINIYF